MFEKILEAFRARGGGPRYIGYCPLHKYGEEDRPSVSLRVAEDRLLVRCFVCGKEATPQIVQAAGFHMRDLFADELPYRQALYRDPFSMMKATAVYVYTDEQGAPLFRSSRYDYPSGGKTFMQERLDEKDGKWRAGIGPPPGTKGAPFSTRRVLYRLHEIVATPGHGLIVVEGEGKADLLASWGLVATCGVGGCGMGWRDEYGPFLRGRRVVVLPDNDVPGFRYAEQVVGAAVRWGAENVRMILLPGIEEKGDVVDWAKAGGDRAQLLQLIKSTPAWNPTP